jgi:hypothetical protein
MIATPDGTAVLSSMGWVDGDALWRVDAASGRLDTIPLGTGARYSSLHHAGSGAGRFAVAHHFDGRRWEVSVRAFSAPDAVLARAAVDPSGTRADGDAAAWDSVPRLYVDYLGFAPWNSFVLLRMSPADAAIEIQRLAWYDESYDKAYQGIVGVLELPGADAALVSVQRSSRLILHDLGTNARRRAIDLGDRGGNPRLALRESGREVWASDYDAIAVLRTDTWQVDRRARLQGARAGTQQFIGGFAFAPDEPVCVVARPFSGDVIGIDPATLKTRRTARLGRQPLEVAALPGGEIIARDWQTGDLLRGALRRRWFGL